MLAVYVGSTVYLCLLLGLSNKGLNLTAITGIHLTFQYIPTLQ